MYQKTNVAICFAVLNNFKGLAEAIHSIKTQHDYTVIVQDQWRDNRPLSKAWNDLPMQAFDRGYEYVLMCNDDIMFAPQTIDEMIQAHRHWNDKGVVMVTPNNILGELGGNPEAILNYQLDPDTEESIADHPNFSCFLIKKDYFEKVGFFDENFVPAWFEDNDSHRRAKLLGYREIVTNLAPMVHIGGVATSKMDNPDSSVSRQYYIRKWGGIPHPESEVFSHPYNDQSLNPTQWVDNQGNIREPLKAL